MSDPKALCGELDQLGPEDTIQLLVIGGRGQCLPWSLRLKDPEEPEWPADEETLPTSSRAGV